MRDQPETLVPAMRGALDLAEFADILEHAKQPPDGEGAGLEFRTGEPAHMRVPVACMHLAFDVHRHAGDKSDLQRSVPVVAAIGRDLLGQCVDIEALAGQTAKQAERLVRAFEQRAAGLQLPVADAGDVGAELLQHRAVLRLLAEHLMQQQLAAAQFQRHHHLHGQRLQLFALLWRERARLVIQHGEHAEHLPALRAQRIAGIEAQ